MRRLIGYISENIGRQTLSGPAIEAIANAADNNNAPQIDNAKWLAALRANRERMDKLHDALFAK